jgi:hypothetical protein
MLAFVLGRGISLIALIALFLLFSSLLMKTAFAQPQPTPGWYKNSGPSTIYDDLKLRITWENSYIYQHPGTDNLYWYAEVVYRNLGTQTVFLTCNEITNPSLAKEHIRGTEGIPPDGEGSVDASETFCSRNPNFTGVIEPGGTFYNWAIFHNVPPGGEVSLEWMPYGFSPWVKPWQSPLSAPPPVVCPPELVTLGTCEEGAIVTKQLTVGLSILQSNNIPLENLSVSTLPSEYVIPRGQTTASITVADANKGQIVFVFKSDGNPFITSYISPTDIQSGTTSITLDSIADGFIMANPLMIGFSASDRQAILSYAKNIPLYQGLKQEITTALQTQPYNLLEVTIFPKTYEDATLLIIEAIHYRTLFLSLYDMSV